MEEPLVLPPAVTQERGGGAQRSVQSRMPLGQVGGVRYEAAWGFLRSPAFLGFANLVSLVALPLSWCNLRWHGCRGKNSGRPRKPRNGECARGLVRRPGPGTGRNRLLDGLPEVKSGVCGPTAPGLPQDRSPLQLAAWGLGRQPGPQASSRVTARRPRPRRLCGQLGAALRTQPGVFRDGAVGGPSGQ